MGGSRPRGSSSASEGRPPGRAGWHDGLSSRLQLHGLRWIHGLEIPIEKIESNLRSVWRETLELQSVVIKDVGMSSFDLVSSPILSTHPLHSIYFIKLNQNYFLRTSDFNWLNILNSVRYMICLPRLLQNGDFR